MRPGKAKQDREKSKQRVSAMLASRRMCVWELCVCLQGEEREREREREERRRKRKKEKNAPRGHPYRRGPVHLQLSTSKGDLEAIRPYFTMLSYTSAFSQTPLCPVMEDG